MRTWSDLRRLGALLAVGCTFATAACSDDDSGEGDAAGSSTTATTAAPTSTTVVATTPTLVVSVHGLVGWWDGSTWVEAREATSTPPLAGGEQYELVSLSASTTSEGGAIGEQEEFCSSPGVTLRPTFPDYGPGEPPPIAVHGVADPQPRAVEQLDVDADVYRDAAEEVLAGLGIDEDDPELAQVVRADLSGDGTDEVLVVVEQIADPEGPYAEAGDYAVLFLRQVVDGEVRTTVLAEDRNESTEEAPSPYLLQPRIGAIADLNGDGAMEVAVHQQYYEGSSTQVFAAGAGAGAGGLEEVMANGCGV